VRLRGREILGVFSWVEMLFDYDLERRIGEGKGIYSYCLLLILRTSMVWSLILVIILRNSNHFEATKT
jgi:hypothetical protein